MHENEILIQYQKMKDETESIWNHHKGTGSLLGLPEGYFKIGITLGRNFFPTEPLITFLNELNNLCSIDS